MTPERFFEKAVPAMILRHYDDFSAEKGVLAFEIRGVGEWNIRFGDSKDPVLKGKPEKYDLFLSFAPGAFTSFVAGKLDLPTALAAKDLVAKGTNFILLESFGELLDPPRPQLGWDAKTMG
jgi:hypothetical protein